jgi:RNA polymerase sigma factor (sigma-70 family)
MTAPEAQAAEFEAHRNTLMGVAYRMLGSVSDAEDMVQETWLRWREAREIEAPRNWLVRVLSRLCLDRLKSARVRREMYHGTWLPEPLVEPSTSGPMQEVDDSLSIALLLVLEKLSPEERRAFYSTRCSITASPKLPGFWKNRSPPAGRWCRGPGNGCAANARASPPLRPNMRNFCNASWRPAATARSDL